MSETTLYIYIYTVSAKSIRTVDFY